MERDIPQAEKKVYVTLYKKDGLAYALALLATLAEFVYVIAILDVMPVSYQMGFTVMVNIALIFLLFSCAVKMNVYQRSWALAALGAAGYMALRAVTVVPLVLRPYGRQTLILAADLAGAALLLAAGLSSLRRGGRRRKLQRALEEQEGRRADGKDRV